MSCAAPLSLDELLAYHQSELESAESERVEEHYFGCTECTRRLEFVASLAAGVRAVVSQGMLSASVSAALLERGIARGLTVRSYHLVPGEQVDCTALPEDDFVAIRLGLAANQAERVDLEVEWTDLESGTQQTRILSELTLDRTTDELVLLFGAPEVRAYPRSRWRMEAVVQHADGASRRVGPYTLNHTPWQQLAP